MRKGSLGPVDPSLGADAGANSLIWLPKTVLESNTQEALTALRKYEIYPYYSNTWLIQKHPNRLHVIQIS